MGKEQKQHEQKHRGDCKISNGMYFSVCFCFYFFCYLYFEYLFSLRNVFRSFFCAPFCRFNTVFGLLCFYKIFCCQLPAVTIYIGFELMYNFMKAFFAL